MPITVLRLAIPSPLARSFDYLPPAGINPAQLVPGMRLRVPFGRGQAIGILLGFSHVPAVPLDKLKPALELLDNTPVLPEELMRLLNWAVQYHHHPVGEVYATALPVLLRQGEKAEARHKSCWRLSDSGHHFDAAELDKRAPKQAALIRRLQQYPEQGLLAEQLAEVQGNWQTAMAALVKKELVHMHTAPSLEQGLGSDTQPPQLNPEQQAALDHIHQHRHSFSPCLLDGVTGSGKTEVYLRAIEQVIADGKQALVLVPEIALTPQLLDRFRRRFKLPLAVMHSAVSDRDRLNAWCYARDGEAAIVIGTRSAVFTPLKNPGIIIVDEEHDTSFKQQSGFRYSARDLAVVRGHQLNIPVVLGTATPSLESLHNVDLKRYQRLHLPQRAGEAKPPRIRLLDVRHQRMEDQLSEGLLHNIRAHLERGNQVLLFLNRRGFAPTLLCHECGWTAECRRCDAHMTLHQRLRQLRCHHCGSQRRVETQCPKCGSVDLRGLGSGTERIEQALREHFPDTPVDRIDRDSTRRQGSLEAILDAMHDGDARILIGTQMLAKGHHFPKVTLVGILDGDQGLFGIDFRAGERMAQLITQVCGRAGRAEQSGEVLIQTHHPEHPLLNLLCQQGYSAFARAALDERRLAALPPFSHMALLRAEANDAQLPNEFLEQALDAAAPFNPGPVELYGPVPSPMERRAGKYRAQLLIQCEQRAPLHKMLEGWTLALRNLPLSRKVRWSLDVDPVDLI